MGMMTDTASQKSTVASLETELKHVKLRYESMESQDSINREKVANKIIALESKTSSLAEETKYLKKCGTRARIGQPED